MWYVSPAFSQFFLRCGAFIERAGQQERPLSSALMKLLNDIWSPSRYLLTAAIALLKFFCFYVCVRTECASCPQQGHVGSKTLFRHNPPVLSWVYGDGAYGTETVQVTLLRRTLASSP